jgi:hypothetical protein
MEMEVLEYYRFSCTKILHMLERLCKDSLESLAGKRCIPFLTKSEEEIVQAEAFLNMLSYFFVHWATDVKMVGQWKQVYIQALDSIQGESTLLLFEYEPVGKYSFDASLEEDKFDSDNRDHVIILRTLIRQITDVRIATSADNAQVLKTACETLTDVKQGLARKIESRSETQPESDMTPIIELYDEIDKALEFFYRISAKRFNPVDGLIDHAISIGGRSLVMPDYFDKSHLRLQKITPGASLPSAPRLTKGHKGFGTSQHPEVDESGRIRRGVVRRNTN